MGQPSPQRVILVALCLILTSLLIYLAPSSHGRQTKGSLSQALIHLDGWQGGELVPIEPKILEALSLDDYANQRYYKGDKVVFLYIGYYYTTAKVGAAHDPMVCFPGQGWLISDRQTGQVASAAGRWPPVSYSAMIAGRASKELLVYWFQSYDSTSPDTFSQKITSLWQKLQRKGEANAFVRLSIPMRQTSLNESLAIADDFIQSFYPVFLRFVQN